VLCEPVAKQQSAIFPILLNLPIVAGLVWIGRRLRAGRNARTAVAAIGAYGVMFLLVALSLAWAGYEHTGTPPVIAAQALLSATWIVAMTAALRARSADRRARSSTSRP
jgi:hypothetical protein